MNQSIDIKAIPGFLIRSKTLIISLVVIALLGFTAYQVSRITAIEPDQAYVTAKAGKTKVPSLKVNRNTMQQLQSLQTPGDTSIPINTGKHNPFSLE